jgi:hypothetical protein
VEINSFQRLIDHAMTIYTWLSLSLGHGNQDTLGIIKNWDQTISITVRSQGLTSETTLTMTIFNLINCID